MKILSIDTTTPFGSVALSEDGNLIAQEQQGKSGTHAERLLISVEHLLTTVGWVRGEINAIAVAVGPGSFTGLRIGLATAKGMVIASGALIAGVSSLEALALNGRGFQGVVVPLIDARRGELYAAAWECPLEKKHKQIFKECVLPPEEVIKKLKKIKKEMLLVGDGAIAYGQKIKDAIGKRVHIAKGSALLPQAGNIAELVLERLKKGKGDNAESLIPNYVRQSDAEIGFLGKKK